MPDTITRCPQCQTAFKVTESQLAVAKGAVRCGSCLAVFKALDYVVDGNGQRLTASPQKAAKANKAPPPEKIAPARPKVAQFNEKKAKKTALEKPQAQVAVTLPKIKADEELISDTMGEERVFKLEDDIYDLAPDKQNSGKKITLFDRPASKSVNKQSEESADESWALDMLAELEDDDEIQPILVKKKPKEIMEEPEQELYISDDMGLLIDDSPTEKEISAAPKKKSAPIRKSKLAPSGGALNDDVLEFDPDGFNEEAGEATNPVNAEDAEAFSSYISDEAIENAMHTRTSYADTPSDYISHIEPSPVELGFRANNQTRGRGLWFLGALLATLIIVAQVAIFRFNTLGTDPTFRPWYDRACEVLGCELPVMVDVNKIRALDLVVRRHPSTSQALIIDAIIINQAGYAQPYPALKIEFSDINNQILAARYLVPDDYLGGELAGATQMPTGRPIQLSVEVVDPGEEAENYQLNVVSR